jgi:hypothetical protein
MTKYWLKIVLGALLIFVVGYSIYRIGERGVTKATSIFATADPISIPLRFAGFSLDNQRLGQIDRLTFVRTAPKSVSSVEIVVQLDDSASAGRLANCFLRLDNPHNIDEHSTFLCATAADTMGTTLKPFGRVLVKGTAVEVPLLVPTDIIRELSNVNFNRSDSMPEIQPAPAVLPAAPAAPATPGTTP